VLDLHDNNITGGLPNEVGDIGLLSKFQIPSSRTPYTIVPNSFLFSIDVLILYSNNMVGSLPNDTGVCSLRSLGDLAELWVDCNIVCPSNCCTKCGPP